MTDGPYSIASINVLPRAEKRLVYARLIPPALLDRFALSPYFVDREGRDLLRIHGHPGTHTVEIALYHRADFPDPLMYCHLADTLTGRIHVLLYILNNPDAPRFDVDRMPDGQPTRFGTRFRNLDAERAALEAGLAPGQVRRGLRLLGQAVETFERWLFSLGQRIYFAEPLYYHNAVLFERHGFTYQSGRELMERIQRGFAPGGDLLPRLDGSTPFRRPEAAHSIRLRSWAIHDGILGQPFTGVTMYKHVGRHAGISTCPDIPW